VALELSPGWFTNSAANALLPRKVELIFTSTRKIFKNKKTCIFLHGAGETPARPSQRELKEYWGEVNSFTPHCKERLFIRQETKNNSWDNIGLQRSYCEALTFDQEDKFLVKNKIIYIHSMGSLVLAGAIKNKICELDSRTTTWYHIAGPLKGTLISKFVKDVCEKRTRVLPEVQQYIAGLFGYCVPNRDSVWIAYESCAPNWPGIDDAFNFAKTRITGSMCGKSTFGLFSEYAFGLSIVAGYVGFGEDSDGFVGVSSCKNAMRERGNNFDDEPTSNTYRANINHADTTCRNGDGYFGGSERKPCSYYFNKN